jgi:peroxiredoxin
MELSNRNSDFQSALQQLEFKTYFRNQVGIFGYENLFANRRVAVFSIVNMYDSFSHLHFKQYDQAYNNIVAAGIDQVYAINSYELMFGPWADKQSGNVMGLANVDMKFVDILSKYYTIEKPLIDMAKQWPFVTVIDNGVPEHIWQNTIKANMQYRVTKKLAYRERRYNNLSPEILVKYLLANNTQPF